MSRGGLCLLLLLLKARGKVSQMACGFLSHKQVTQNKRSSPEKRELAEREKGENTYKVSFCKTVWDARRTQEQ